MLGGARVWYFPDGYLPEKSMEGKMDAHEALMLMNTANEKALIELDFYFSERVPMKNIPIEVNPESVISLRLDHPAEIGGVVIEPLTQYAIRVRSQIPIVAQFGRLDTTQPNMAYYGTMGYCEA